MANVLIQNLTVAAAPVASTDTMLISRDGTVVSKVAVVDAVNGLMPTINVASPNNTVPVEAVVASNTGGVTYANIDAAVVPKGTGSFALAIADGLVTGGNKRGTNAIDLQTSRTAATQVASGNFSFVAGQNNTSGGTQASSLGLGNSASGNQSVAFGNANTSSGTQSVALGNTNTTAGSQAVAFGSTNTVAGNNASALGGASNTVSGVFSSSVGGQNATTNGIQGQVAFGHNSNLLGGYQTTLTGLRQVTTGTTATRATADAATASTANQLVLRNNSVFKVMGRAVAYDLTTLDAKEWEISLLIKRGANAAATSIVGTPSITSNFADTAAAAWTIAASADTTNGALAITVTGAGANQIRWYIELFAYETGV